MLAYTINKAEQRWRAVSAFQVIWRSLLTGGILLFITPLVNGSFASLIVHNQELGDVGIYEVNSKVELQMTASSQFIAGGSENPFSIKVDVAFTAPDGRTLTIPAFFDGDGSGSQEGNIWKVRFSPDVPGIWGFTSTSSSQQIPNYEGSFTVTDRENCSARRQDGTIDFACAGNLFFDGDHYLRFRNGEYWIKGGIDDPENFLGNAFGDWDAKKAVIDTISSKGVNSIYIITNNIDGDRNDTWPWLGNTPSEAKANSDEFDIARLQRWEDFFSYVESKGIVLHIVLNDDGAWNGYNHESYFREMIARFGHHPGIIWNLGEEANEIYSDNQQVDLARMLKDLDPYDHPVTVHRRPTWPFLGNPNFDLTSIQVGEGADDFTIVRLPNLNNIVANHRAQSVANGRPIPVMIDETPRVTRVTEATRLKMRAQVLYPIYFAGGNFELHFFDIFGQGGTVTIEELGPMLEDMLRVRQFLEKLPFEQMVSCNELIDSPQGYCFGKRGEVYAIYIPPGGEVTVDLSGIPGSYVTEWYNPRTGETNLGGILDGGSRSAIASPNAEDWVLHLTGEALGLLPCGVQNSTDSSEGSSQTQVDLSDLPPFQMFMPVSFYCGQ